MDWDALSKVWRECYEEAGLSPVNLPEIVESLSSPVLLIGAGAGRNLSFLKELGFSVIGIDTSPSMIALAREQGIEIVHGDGQLLPFADGSFSSVIISTGVINSNSVYSDEFDKLLSETSRVLKARGSLCAGFLRRDEVLNYVFSKLSLYGEDSNNYLLYGPENLQDACASFLENTAISEKTVKFIFDELSPYLEMHRKLIVKVASTLERKGEDPSQFIRRYTGFGDDDMGVCDVAYLRFQMAKSYDIKKYQTLSHYLVSVVIAEKLPEL